MFAVTVLLVACTSSVTSNAVLDDSQELILYEKDIVTHNTLNDCWVLTGGEVYDITAYLADNPDVVDYTVPLCGGLEDLEKYFDGESNLFTRFGVLKGTIIS